VTRVTCPECLSELHGKFSVPSLARLPKELQDVAVTFLRRRGNFREVEEDLGISYPTVSKKLDAINLFLEAMGTAEDSPSARILRRVDSGELAVREAVELIRQQAQANNGGGR
jgi:hypothetical protein